MTHQSAPDEDSLVAAADAAIEFGRSERNRRNYPQAQQHYEEAVLILRNANRPHRLAHTIRHVGDILFDQGLYARALPYFEEALSIYRSSGPAAPLDLANALRGAALTEERLEHRIQARALWRQARRLYVAVEVQPGVDEADVRLAALAAD